MEYKWDLEKIEKLKKEYNKLLVAKKFFAYDKVRANIWELEKMADILNFNCLMTDEEEENTFDDDILNSVSTFYKVNKWLKKYLVKSTKELRGLKFEEKDYELFKIDLSDSDLVSMSHDFFNTLPDKSYQPIIDRFTNPKENLIQFYKNDSDSFTSCFYYPIYTPYFLVDREDTIEDFCTLNHELAHGIFYQNNNQFNERKLSFFLGELEGYFFEFLSIEFLKERDLVDTGSIKKLRAILALSGIGEISIFYCQYVIAYLYHHKIKINEENVTKKLLEDDLDLDIDPLYYIFRENDALSTAKYALSFLVSLGIENIYNQDKEYAFYLFNKIRNDNKIKLSDLIKNNLLNDNYQNLKEQVKKLGSRISGVK